MTDADKIINPLHNLPDNLPDWASPGNWLGPEGHAGFKKPVDDESLCNLCSFPLKMFNDEAETMGAFQWASRPPTGDQPVTRSQWNASG